jgi:hypothetical protein
MIIIPVILMNPQVIHAMKEIPPPTKMMTPTTIIGKMAAINDGT